MSNGSKVNDILAEREATHGNFAWNMRCIGRAWTAILEAHWKKEMPDLPGYVVALMMDSLKTQRTLCGSYTEDHYIDKGGYTRIAKELQNKRKPRGKAEEVLSQEPIISEETT